MREEHIMEQYVYELASNNQEHVEQLLGYSQKYMGKVAARYGYKFGPCWDLEDFTMDVVCRVLNQCGKFDASRSGFNTWISMLARSVYTNHIERNKCVETIPCMALNEDGEEYNIIDKCYSNDSTENEVISQFTYEEIMYAIEALPENYSKAIRFCCIEGYKVSEAARIVGCESKDISRWLNRGKKALVKILKQGIKHKCDDYERD